MNQSPLQLQASVSKTLAALGMTEAIAASVGTSVVTTAVTSIATATKLTLVNFQNIVNERTARNTKVLIEEISKLLNSTHENWTASSSQQETFKSLFERAINEEDEQKLPVYTGLFQWIIEASPSKSLIRMTGAAIAQLTFAELRGFVDWVHGTGRVVVTDGIPQSVFWQRIDAWGLTTGGGVRSTQNISPTGAALAKYCPWLAYSEGELRKLGFRT